MPKSSKTAAAVVERSRLAVRKTYKLYVGGKFPRSESGRTYLVDGDNVALASRKDARDAVVAARAAQTGWAGATAYNRGQILYRVAEMLEGRRAQFVEEVRAGVVWSNTFNKFDPTSPFGGYKESGFGREGGRQWLEAYLDV